MSVCIEERAGAVGFEQHHLKIWSVCWVCEEGCWEDNIGVRDHVGECWLCES